MRWGVAVMRARILAAAHDHPTASPESSCSRMLLHHVTSAFHKSVIGSETHSFFRLRWFVFLVVAIAVSSSSSKAATKPILTCKPHTHSQTEAAGIGEEIEKLNIIAQPSCHVPLGYSACLLRSMSNIIGSRARKLRLQRCWTAHHRHSRTQHFLKAVHASHAAVKGIPGAPAVLKLKVDKGAAVLPLAAVTVPATLLGGPHVKTPAQQHAAESTVQSSLMTTSSCV